MGLPPALLEDWMREYYFSTEVDIGSSGVDDYSMAELRAMLGITVEEIDAVVFQDSQTLGGEGIRHALAARWTRSETARVMATHGSSEANFLVMNALLSPGDEVVVVDPCYQQLYAIAETMGCVIRQWPLRYENGWVPDMEEGKRLIGPRTRMVVANFPHNPTGASVDAAAQLEIVAACARVGAYLVWDSAFGDLTYDEPPLVEPGRFYDRAISMGTFSKAYGLPGLRVGWCFAAPQVLERMARVRDYVTLHLSPLVELVAERAIRGLDALLQPRLELARANRALVSRWMDEHADFADWVPSRGGVCGFPRLHAVPDVDAFCHRLAQEHGTLLVPGSCFGRPGHVRLGFGRETASLEAGLARLSALLQESAVPAAR